MGIRRIGERSGGHAEYSLTRLLALEAMRVPKVNIGYS